MIQRGCQSVGIDLGTTYSSLAYLDSKLLPHVVSDSSGQSVTPSAVYFEQNEVIVGDIALQQAKIHAERCIQFIKLHMGEKWRREIDGQVHTPESISAYILGHLIRESAAEIGPITKAVITVPAYFTEKRRRATQQAGELAGLEVIGTLNEPMAAALAHGLYRNNREQTALVYDLGGGTFDVTIVRIAPNELEELVTCGNRQLGGRDWDLCLAELVAEDYQKNYHVDLRSSYQATQDLQYACEQAKRRLSRVNGTNIRVHAHGKDHVTEVTRQQFEQATSHLVQTTRLTAEMALEDAGLDWNQIDRVLLVGGATHMPMIRAMIQQASGREGESAINPVTAVSMGAAIYAHMLEIQQAPKQSRGKPPLATGPDSRNPLPPATDEAETVLSPRVRFVTAHGVGVKARAKDQWSNIVLIPKNTPVPTSISRVFFTKRLSGHGSRVRIQVTQGNTRDVELADVLGTACIEGIPFGQPSGQPVRITLSFDAQGRLHLHAVHESSGKELQISLDVPGGLQADEVERYRQMIRSRGVLPDVAT